MITAISETRPRPIRWATHPVRSIPFEGRPVSQASLPYVIGEDQWRELGRFARDVWRRATLAVGHIYHDPRHPLNLFYRRELDLFQAARVQDQPAWMRLDIGWTAKGEPQVLELNTACPGGWVLTPMATRELWGRHHRHFAGLTGRAPDPDHFAQCLIKRLGRRILLANLFKEYQFELDELAHQLRYLGADAVVLDPADPAQHDQIRRFRPSGLYWKSNPLRMTEAAEPVAEVLEWCQGVSLPSPEWMFLGEDKRVLAEIDPRLTAATRPLSEVSLDELLDRQLDLVLKPSNLTRGQGIKRGLDHHPDSWREEGIRAIYSPQPYVVQELCCLRKIRTDQGVMYGDLMLYMTDGEVVGAGARVSMDPIVNLGQRGALQAVATS